MLKRLLLILAAAFGLVVVGAATANASENGHGGHHQKAGHHKVVKHHKVKHQNHHKVNHHPSHPQKPGCICKPKPKPPGGWPCAQTHSCKPHKPKPVCHPGHHHKPPHVKPPHHHKPPHVTPPKEKPPVHVVKHHKPPVHLSTTNTAEMSALPRTGGFAENIFGFVLLALLAGCLLMSVPRRRSGDAKLLLGPKRPVVPLCDGCCHWGERRRLLRTGIVAKVHNSQEVKKPLWALE
jgi:hypothetical protein